VLSRRGLCDELIARTEEPYRLWCVVCDLSNLVNEAVWPTASCCVKDKQTNERTIDIVGEMFQKASEEMRKKSITLMF